MLAGLVMFAACGEVAPEPGGNGGDGSPELSTRIEIPPVDGPYDWTIDPADFVVGVDNPYFPLTPGTVWISKGESDGEPEVVTVRATHDTKEILGVTCVVVRDTVRVAGEVAE